LDAIEQKVQDTISDGTRTDVVLKNLDSVFKITRSNIDASVTTVLTSGNQPYIDDMKKYVSKFGIKLCTKGMGYYMSDDANQDEINEMSGMLPTGGVRNRFMVDGGKIIGKKTFCGSMMKPIINADGDVSICCHDMLFEEKCGNILAEGSLNKVLNSQQYKNKVKLGSDMKLGICRGCN
jgi:hypothetical protein